MKMTKQETHYMKNMVLLWSTSVEKEIVTLPLFIYFLFFFFFFWAFLFSGLSSFFLFLFFLWPFFFLFGLSLFFGTMLYEWWSSQFYLFTTQWLQLDTRTKYDSIWMPPAVYRDMQWIKSDKYEEIMNGGFATNTMSTTWSC